MTKSNNSNIFLSENQKQILNDLVQARYTPKIIAMRANIILLLAEEKALSVIRNVLNISYPPIYKWQKRWLQSKATLDQIEMNKTKHELIIAIENTFKDSPRPGSPPIFTEVQVLQIIALACTSPSEENLPVSHWSCRLLAEYAQKKGIVKGISHSQISVFLKSGESKMLVKF
jgi:putative transposase